MTLNINLKSILLLAFLISGKIALPIEDENEDTVVMYPDELNDDENEVDGGDKIDLSHLGPDVYGMPKNESGE